jgi:hypothetical protein
VTRSQQAQEKREQTGSESRIVVIPEPLVLKHDRAEEPQRRDAKKVRQDGVARQTAGQRPEKQRSDNGKGYETMKKHDVQRPPKIVPIDTAKLGEECEILWCGD